jgi:OOP family OmpA-OmpF porin
MKLTAKKILSAAAVAALLPVPALAQNYPNQGYLVDGSGKIVTSPVAGLCWHTGDWTPALAVEPCDPTIKRMAVVAAVPAAKPAEVAAAPVAVMPVPVAKPVPTKMSFSADALFAFDKSDIKPEGKVMLDDLVRQINGAQYDQIMLTGHADRIGNATYNHKLSERRATSVKDYLVEKQIPAARVSASGVGEAQPVTQASDCARAKMPKLVACLQPDRRVDVEMTGTKTATAGK